MTKMPYLSLYQPTHRSLPGKLQDPIRFRNLVKSLESQLRMNIPAREVEPLLAPFHALADDHDFWMHSGDGLAVLAAPGVFQTHRLQRTVPELAVVADSFHTKPLLRILQSADRYQILGVSRQEIRLYEGNRDALGEIPLAPGVPRTITDALGDELTEPEVESDAQRFFRVVDRAVTEHHSRPSGLPLLLAALPEHHSLFREMSRNPLLMDSGLDINPAVVSLDQLRERAWKVIEPRYRARLAGFVDDFGAARASGLCAEALPDVAIAAISGRIATLLIDADRVVPGRLDIASGAITLAPDGEPGVDDLLDDIAEQVLKTKGEVVVVPAERMPTKTGAAAIFRF